MTIGILLGVDQFHKALVNFGLLIHQVKDTLGASRRRHHEVDLLTHLDHRVGKAFIQTQEGNHRTNGHTGHAVDPQHCTNNGHHHIAQPSNVRIDGHQKVGIPVGFVSAVPQGIINLTKIPLSSLFMAEYLDHFLAIQHFLDKAVHCAQISLLVNIVFPGAASQFAGNQQHNNSGNHWDNGQHRVEHQHGNQGGNHGDHRVDNLRNALADHLTKGIHVVGVHRHNVAMGVGIKILNGK